MDKDVVWHHFIHRHASSKHHHCGITIENNNNHNTIPNPTTTLVVFDNLCITSATMTLLQAVYHRFGLVIPPPLAAAAAVRRSLSVESGTTTCGGGVPLLFHPYGRRTSTSSSPLLEGRKRRKRLLSSFSISSARSSSTTTAATDSAVPVQRHDDTQTGVTYLTLNRPKQYNAMNEAMITALQDHFNDIAKQPQTIRVVVVRANGPAFCAGHDLKEMIRLGKQKQQSPPPESPSSLPYPDNSSSDKEQQIGQPKTVEEEYYFALFRKCSQMMMTIPAMPQPVIAQVHGIATAAGCQFVAACDMAVAAHETAQFATSGINVGLFCATPSVALLLGHSGMSRKQAFDMLFTGDFISADTAVQYGLVNRVVPLSQLEATVQSFTTKLVSKSPEAIQRGKALLYHQYNNNHNNTTLQEAYDYASQVMASNMMTHDTQQGIYAFVHKQPLPVYGGGGGTTTSLEETTTHPKK
jgi:enoyl-CoA hydratase/carnithine racemase